MPIGILLLLAAGAVGYLTVIDRQSSIALSVVEIDGMLPVPIYALLGLAGAVLIGVDVVKRLSRPKAGPVTEARRRGPTMRTIDGGQAGFRQRVTERAQGLALPEGCALLIDAQAGVPFTLLLDQVPPGRGKRAIEQTGSFIASLPVPPRLVVEYKSCPPSTGPRHNEVRGALSARVPRGSFRVTSHVDRVDVVFLQPDPVWKTGW